MPMQVVQVWRMRMRMHERGVSMPVHVGLARRVVRLMHMLMVFIMRVRVQMSCRLMAVGVLVAF
jgi:hypothetical protein